MADLASAACVSGPTFPTAPTAKFRPESTLGMRSVRNANGSTESGNCNRQPSAKSGWTMRRTSTGKRNGHGSPPEGSGRRARPAADRTLREGLRRSEGHAERVPAAGHRTRLYRLRTARVATARQRLVSVVRQDGRTVAQNPPDAAKHTFRQAVSGNRHVRGGDRVGSTAGAADIRNDRPNRSATPFIRTT